MSGPLQPRAAVMAMGEYHPPLAGRNGLLLDFNENTWSPSPAVLRVLENVSAAQLTVYPERDPVEQLAANILGVAHQELILTNGVDEGIHLVSETFLEPGDEVILAVPTFGMYRVFAQMTGATVIESPAGIDFAFPAQEILAAITTRTRMIAFATPNNPTGSVASRDQILALCRAAPNAAVLVDEAYFHFHGETVLDAIRDVPNLVVARTFSKAYGLAGLRIGALLASAETLQWIRKVASPYNVNALALACLPAALDDVEYLRWYVEHTLAGRAMLEDALDELRVPHWPSHANFALTRIGPRHAEFVSAMRERGILVRDRSRDPGCDGCVRITAGLAEQMPQAIAAIREVAQSMQWKPEEAR